MALYGVKKKGGAFFIIFFEVKTVQLIEAIQNQAESFIQWNFLQKKSQTTHFYSVASAPRYMLSGFYLTQKIKDLAKMPKYLEGLECTDYSSAS